MKKYVIIVGMLAALAACTKVPYTDRRQFNLISSEQENQLGAQAFQEVQKTTPPSKNTQAIQSVATVGQRIAAAANREDFKWEFTVLQGDQINAFCLPGGKVAFFEPILPICETDAGIAVVMGHEVAHALARHGGERISQTMGAQLVGNVLAVGLGNAEPAVRDNVLQLYGVGAQVGGLLRWGRKQELEADQIGLILMAKAGYDPRESVNFWKRMQAKSKGGKPPEFLSTHPSDERRISELEAFMPEALKHYQPQ